eukprot:jgi/Tetstr1/439522/TSEL_027951.t1
MNLFEARSHKQPPRLARIDALLEQADLYNPINVTEFLEAMRKGLSNPFMCWAWRYGESRVGLALHHIRKQGSIAVFEYRIGGKLPFGGNDEAPSLASYALFADDPNIIFDLRKLNEHATFNISIRAMVDKVMKALKEEHGGLEEAGTSVPSHARVELQFCPKNILATRALAFTDGLKHILPKFKPNGQHKLKNVDKQPAKQALERMRGGHPQ